jgi:hypothetical protein
MREYDNKSLILVALIVTIILFSIFFGLVLLDLLDKVTLVEQLVWAEMDKTEDVLEKQKDLYKNFQKQSDTIAKKQKVIIQKKNLEKSAFRIFLESFFGVKKD